MRTNFNFDTFLYYGVILDRSIVHELALKNGFSTIYDFVEENNLSYQKIGDNRFSTRIIFGKEIHWDYGSNITEINIKDNLFDLLSNFQLDEKDQVFKNELNFDYKGIQSKLEKLGVEINPKHYIITNYGGM